MAILIDCIAAIPSAVGRRARTFITETEKAKKSPRSPAPERGDERQTEWLTINDCLKFSADSASA